MAVRLPDHYLQRRDLLHHPRTPRETLVAVARAYMERSSFSDALDFFEKAEDREGVAEIKKVALENGDTFLLARLERFDPSLVQKADWEQVGQKAQAAGKSSMTAFAQKRLTPAPSGGEEPGEQPIEE